MTTEQKKAIKVLKQYKNECIEEYKVELDDKKNIDEQHASYLHQQIEAVYIILNLIQEQEKEIDCLKNHVHYKICQICGEEFRAKRNDAKFCKKCVKTVAKEWYKNLTDEQKAKRREQSKSSMRKIRERRKND